LDEILRHLKELTKPTTETLVHVFDILVVAYLIYRLLSLTRGSRAWRILGGIVAFVLLLFVSDWLQLTAMHWVLDKATLLAPVALVILLLPELRQALEGVSKLGFWPKSLAGAEVKTEERTVEALVSAASELSTAMVGALIVVERDAPLDEIIHNGVRLDAQVSSPLLGAIFYDQNPLHDGAVIVRGDSLVAAACRLPLSENPTLARNLHMRHRAAVGITEQTDCLAIVVSEERGSISVVEEGALEKVSPQVLRERLNEALRGIGRSTPKSGRTLRTRTRESAKEERLEKPVA
jgi:diadenylate cyclase